MAGGALATGLAITAGQLQFFLYGGLLLGLYGLLRLAASPPEQRRRGIWAGAAIAGLGLALGAVHVLPTYAVALDTIRPPFTWEALRQTGLPWRQLVTLVAPWFMGHPGRGDYRGAQNASELMAYVGLLPLLAALTAWWIRRDRLTALFSGLALLVMAIALATPLAWPLAHTPWLQRFGLMRWLALWPLVVAPLLALVLDAVASGAVASDAVSSGAVASAGAASAGAESAGRPAVTATARRLRVLPLAAALPAALAARVPFRSAVDIVRYCRKTRPNSRIEKIRRKNRGATRAPSTRVAPRSPTRRWGRARRRCARCPRRGFEAQIGMVAYRQKGQST